MTMVRRIHVAVLENASFEILNIIVKLLHMLCMISYSKAPVCFIIYVLLLQEFSLQTKEQLSHRHTWVNLTDFF